MAPSRQNVEKVVLVAVGPMTDNFQDNISMCVNGTVNQQPPNTPALVQASDVLVLLHVRVFPKSVVSKADFVGGGLQKEMVEWSAAEDEKQDFHTNRETLRAERVLKEFRLLCKKKVNHVTTRVEWAHDVHSKVAEVANSIGATHIVMGTDVQAKSKTLSINLRIWKSRPTDPDPVHVPLGSKVAALVHCTIYCISLTSGKLVRELKGEAPIGGDPLPRPDSAGSSGMSTESPFEGESGSPLPPGSHALPASRSLPRMDHQGANVYWHSPPGSYPISAPPPGYYNHHAHFYIAPGPGGVSPEPRYTYPVTNSNHSGDLVHAPGPFGQPGTFHPSPGVSGSAPEEAYPDPVTRPGGSGQYSHPPDWPNNQRLVSRGFAPNRGPTAPPLFPTQYSEPQFQIGVLPGRADQYGASELVHAPLNHETGYAQNHVNGRGYFQGYAGGPGHTHGVQVPLQGSGSLSEQLMGAHPSPGQMAQDPGFMGARYSESPVGQPIGQQPAPPVRSSAHRPTRSEVQQHDWQQPVDQNVLSALAGATRERAAVQEMQAYEVYTFKELREATADFSHELGGGGFGTVYLGTLRGTKVAVKKMNPEELQGPAQFECEVKLLTKLRHSNIVILMGCCPEAFCLVYEYCAHGSLEERLADQSRPLWWYTRMRIMYEISTALLWMHRRNIIHCDIKLANILLDGNDTAKLGDVGISQVIPDAEARATVLRTSAYTASQMGSSVRGTFDYMDPALFIPGSSLTASSDVYALGVCLLQMLTNGAADAVKRDVYQAYVRRDMPGILDHSGGDWPLDTVVEDLTSLSLRCIEADQWKRPDLEEEIIPVLSRLNDLGKVAERQELESLRRAAAEMAALRAPGARPRDNSDILEAQIRCPLSLEIMEDPVVAADGHTYERSFIQKWLDISRTSPATGLPLPNANLISNQAVKSAALEWKDRNGDSVDED